MKKIIHKLLRRAKRSASGATPPSSLRITNETVAEHREHILAAGRRFKYPHHYPRHRIVLVTVLIVLLLGGILSAFAGWQLYEAQDTGDLLYNVTQILPLPVASIDGQNVRYSDYLLRLRSSLYYLSTKESLDFSTPDGKRQLDYQKRLALDNAIEDAYIQKLAAQKKIAVTDKEVNTFITLQIKNDALGVSESALRQVIKDYYNWTFEDYKQSVKEQLLKVKVKAAVDTTGQMAINTVLQELHQGQDFGQLAKNSSEDAATKANGGDMGFVVSTDDPNNFTQAAQNLQVGQTSGVIDGVDGFYIIKVLEKRQSSVHLAKIFVGYKTFDQQLAGLKKAGKIREYIKVPAIAAPTGQ